MQKERVAIALLLHMGDGAIGQVLRPLGSIGTIRHFDRFFSIIVVGLGLGQALDLHRGVTPF